MKLIKMTDFVLSFGTESNRCNYEQAYDKISSYAKFLKTNLNLGMFIPCDEKFNILKQPNHYRRYLSKDYLTESPKMSEKWVEKCEEYKKAESKILFKDFHFFIEEDGEKCVAIEGFVLEIEDLCFMKVEDITDQDIELTSFCINAIN
jgi:hypothetical protein